MVELMIAMAISLLLLLLGLVNIYVNIGRSNEEMAKTGSLIENGRFALQILESDLVHAGFWGGHLPSFDDLTTSTVPGDVPSALPNPCQPYSSWDSFYRIGLLGIPVQTSDTLPTGAGCAPPAAQRPGTDVLTVRHVDTCVPGSANCEPLAAGKLYFQASTCAAEKTRAPLKAAPPTPSCSAAMRPTRRMPMQACCCD
jgi:type IV pilus assembly protein PilW